MKIVSFLAICAYILAAIGGTAYLFYFGQPLFGVTNILLAALAFPKVKECFNKLIK